MGSVIWRLSTCCGYENNYDAYFSLLTYMHTYIFPLFSPHITETDNEKCRVVRDSHMFKCITDMANFISINYVS